LNVSSSDSVAAEVLIRWHNPPIYREFISITIEHSSLSVLTTDFPN